MPCPLPCICWSLALLCFSLQYFIRIQFIETLPHHFPSLFYLQLFVTSLPLATLFSLPISIQSMVWKQNIREVLFEQVMQLRLALKGLEFSRKKKKKWVVLLTAFGLTSYGLYRVYHLPSIAQKRKRVFKLLGALVAMAEAVSDCAQTFGVVSKDMKDFLQSETDQIPNSLKQVSKITRSNEFSQSIVRVTQALTVGLVRGYHQLEARGGNDRVTVNPSSMDQVMDKLFSEAGVGFASVVVGSFARNLVVALCSEGESDAKLESNPNSLAKNSVPSWLNVVSGDRCRALIGDSIQLFVSSMVSVYFDKTKHVNTYDELFAGLTNPKHQTQVRDVMVTVCNNAIETLVKTSHQVLTSSDSSNNPSSSVFPSPAIEYKQDAASSERNSTDSVKNDGWVSKVSSSLAEPSNRKFVLDITGRITFETVRSFLEFLLQTVYQGVKNCVEAAHEAALEGGVKLVRYVSAKSSVVATLCLSLCLHVLGGVWILVPA